MSPRSDVLTPRTTECLESLKVDAAADVNWGIINLWAHEDLAVFFFKAFSECVDMVHTLVAKVVAALGGHLFRNKNVSSNVAQLPLPKIARSSACSLSVDT